MSGVSAAALATGLLKTLATPAYQTIASAYNLESDLRELQGSIDIISQYLEDAEDKLSKEQCKPRAKQPAGIASINEWLKQLKEVFEDASDILDEIEYEALRKQVVKDCANFIIKVLHFCSGSNPLAFRFKMSCKIKGIRERIDTVASHRSIWGFKAIDHSHDNKQSLEQLLSWRETQSDLPSCMTGRDGEKEQVIRILRRPQSQFDKIDVIAIVGRGGAGKTTLAQQVYNDERVKNHFLRLWVYVSNEFGLKRLIYNILQEADKSRTVRISQKSTLQQLKESLHGVLRRTSKKFLLVLDDVWNEDAGRWRELYDVLLALGYAGNKNGSKIIVTTRSPAVASAMGSVLVHRLGELPLRECQELFFKCAFPNGVGEKYQNLEEIGVQIVHKCKGLPLAVVTLGRLLCLNYNEKMWKDVRDAEFWELEEGGQISIMPALRLSYNQLAPQLKQCFAYCSIFPKDYLYNDFHMIPFWMAHGLLQPKNNKEPERVGESYMDELLVKFFFQPQYGRIEKFNELVGNICVTLHDIFHDLAVLIMKNEQVIVTSGCTSVDKNVRHLSFWNHVFPIVGHRYPDKVRTINAPRMGGEDHEISKFLNWIVNRFRHLRVLDLTGSSLKSLPHGLGKMKHLRYLRLLHCYFIKELPHSICDLHNLQCLDLERCDSLEKLPNNMGGFLVSLRTFFITIQDSNLSYIDVGRFKSLQVLTITDCDNLVSLPRDLWHLTTLKKLFIWRCPELVSFEDEENGGNPEELAHSLRLSLQIFEISGMPKLSVLPHCLTRNAANSLEVLSIQYCRAMSSLPEEMTNLRKLEHLFIIGCPQLVPSCYQDIGSEYRKIAHIPNIYVSAIE